MANLKHHMSLKCDGKQFQCNACKKLFNNYSVMVVHKRMHVGKRPYKCVGCEEGFSCAANLKSHYKIHKQFSCCFYEYDKSVTNLSSYEVNAEQNSCKWNKHRQIYSGEYFTVIEPKSII